MRDQDEYGLLAFSKSLPLQALDLGRGGMHGNYMVEEIWQELAKARYTIWEHAAMVHHQQQPELKCVYVS